MPRYCFVPGSLVFGPTVRKQTEQKPSCIIAYGHYLGAKRWEMRWWSPWALGPTRPGQRHPAFPDARQTRPERGLLASLPGGLPVQCEWTGRRGGGDRGSEKTGGERRAPRPREPPRQCTDPGFAQTRMNFALLPASLIWRQNKNLLKEHQYNLLHRM